MNHSAANHVAMRARATMLAEITALVICTMQFAQNVVNLARFHSSRVQTVLFIVATALKNK